MKIAVNGKALGTTEKTGVVRVALSLIRHIALLRRDFVLELLIPGAEAVAFDLPENVKVRCFGAAFWRNSLTRSLWEQAILPWHLRRQGDYALLLNLTNSAPVLISPQAPQILLVHDVGFQNKQWFSNLFSSYLQWVVTSAAKQGVRFVTVSQTSAQQLSEMLPQIGAITVVPNDADEPPALVGAKRLPYRYGLFIGSLNPRKNISGAILGFQKFSAAMPDEVRLHIVGGENGIYAALPENLREFKNVVFQGFVDEAEKWAFLKGAEFLLLPSFLEGFGLPVLEALKIGTPVVASDIPVFRELFDDAIEYVDPHSPEDIGRGIREIMSNQDKRIRKMARGQQIAKHFSWPLAAQKYVELIEEMATGNKL